MQITPINCLNSVLYQIQPIKSTKSINIRENGDNIPSLEIYSHDEEDSEIYEYRLIGTVKNEDFTQVQG